MAEQSRHSGTYSLTLSKAWPKIWAKAVTDFILPPVCLNCHQATADTNQLCPTCWQQITFISSPFCQLTGEPLPFDIGENAISAAAAKSPPAYDRARAVALYEGTMRELIHKLKYQDRHEVTTLMANWLISTGQDFLNQADVLIPIPLHRQRLWRRRFNQSTLLAKRISEMTDKPVDFKSFARKKNTQSQVGLSETQRKSNLQGAFHIPEHRVNHLNNRSVLIIDDVITTGATANAAAKTMKNAGAKQVNLLCLALVLPS